MEPLSSFAISLAAGIALDYYNYTQNVVKRQLKSAFNQALKEWCPNEIIREDKRNQIKKDLEELFKNPESLITSSLKKVELTSFLKKYEEILAAYSSAFDYIKEIKDLERFKREIELLLSIRDSLKDLNDKIDFLKEKLQSLNSELEREWIRQLDVYKTSIQKFKPKTALELLTKLEDSFNLSETKPGNSIKATVEFLKGQCFEYIGNMQEMHKCYIKSYRLDNSSIYSKEKACFAFAKNKKPDEANLIIKEIFQFDEYNPIAWAVKVILSEDNNLANILESIPELAREDENFRRIVYVMTRSDERFSDAQETFRKFQILPDINSWDKTSLTFNNYKYRTFLIEAVLSEMFQFFYISFYDAFTGDIQLVKSTKPILEDFLKQLAGTEIIQRFYLLEFYNEYFSFILNGEKDSVARMKSIFDEYNLKDSLQVMILANCLQQIGNVNDAIIVLKTQANKNPDLLRFESFCYLKKNDVENYISCSHEILKLTKTVDINSCEFLLEIANTLNEFGRIDEIQADDFLKDKEFEFDYLKVLVSEFISIVLKNNSTQTVKNLQQIEEELLTSESKLIFYVSYSYYLLEEVELAIELFRKYLDKNKESRNLLLYIKSLDKSSIYNEELLQCLAHWRENFSFNAEFLQLEADLRRQLSDWKNCAIICEYFLSVYANEESFLTLYLISISETDRPDKNEIIEKIANIFSTYNFKNNNRVTIVSNILAQYGYHLISLNILYKVAIIKENKQARMDYFTTCIHIPSELIKEKPVVDKGLFVKYELNSEIFFIEINDHNILSKSLLGHVVGDIVTIERPMVSGFDSIKILRIMDKYLYLHDEILEEVKNNPYSGIPMQSIEFKDTSPEGLIKTLTSLFGPSGTLLKEKKENAFLEYYNYKLSFSEIVLRNYSSDYIGGYFDLIHYRDGFTLIPAHAYPPINLAKNKNFVIDYSSLLILFQISREHEIKFEHNFIVSKGILDYLRAFKKKESSNIGEQMSIDVSMNGVSKFTKPEEAFKSNIQYLIKLIDWIENNCIVKIAVSRLNVTRKLERELNNETFSNYIIDNISLTLEHENCILISDDSIYLRIFPLGSGKTVSSEIYVSSYFGGNISIMSEFIKNKYIGISVSKDMLINEFNRKIKDQINNYNHCLNNLSLALNPERQNITTAIQFLKEIFMTSLLPSEFLRREAVGVFVILLKGYSQWEVFRIVELLIKKEFELLGAKLDLIIESFKEAIEILNFSKQ